MTLYPAATWLPVVNHGGPMTAHIGLVLHVQEGNGSLYGWFNNPSSQVSANWWVSKTGTVEQYVDADVEAWAQAAGNPTYNSVETEGLDTEPLTPQQVTALADLYRWGHQTYGWPYSLSNAPGAPGLAWHGMGGIPWGNHPGCPGVLRMNARPLILALAEGANNMTSLMNGSQMHVWAQTANGVEHWWFDTANAAAGWHHEVLPQ